MAGKVTVVVSGGNVQDCYADSADVDVEVVDFDNLEAEGPQAVRQAEEYLSRLSKSMQHVY